MIRVPTETLNSNLNLSRTQLKFIVNYLTHCKQQNYLIQLTPATSGGNQESIPLLVPFWMITSLHVPEHRKQGANLFSDSYICISEAFSFRFSCVNDDSLRDCSAMTLAVEGLSSKTTWQPSAQLSIPWAMSCQNTPPLNGPSLVTLLYMALYIFTKQPSLFCKLYPGILEDFPNSPIISGFFSTESESWMWAFTQLSTKAAWFSSLEFSNLPCTYKLGWETRKIMILVGRVSVLKLERLPLLRVEMNGGKIYVRDLIVGDEISPNK